MKKMKRISLALIMTVTVFFVLSAFSVYADTAPDEGAAIDNREVSEETGLSLEEAVVTLNSSEYTYTGDAIQPVPDVTLNGSKLVEGVDYSLSYDRNVNVGRAQVIITGEGRFTGQIKYGEFNIVAADISKAKVSMVYKYYNYKGSSVKPVIKVSYNGKTLKEGTDYTVHCSNNIYPGKKSFEIRGINNFTSYKKGTSYIANVSGFGVKKTGTTTISFKWNNEPGVTGYEIMKYNLSESKW